MSKKALGKIITLMLSLSLVFVLTACGSTKTGTEITMPYNYDHYIGTEIPVDMVVEELEKLGYSNITKTEITKGMYYFKVESVEIDGEKKFEKGDVFYSDSPIEIKYYGDIKDDGRIHGLNIYDMFDKAKELNAGSWDSVSEVSEVKIGLNAKLNKDGESHIDVEISSNDSGIIDWISITVDKSQKEFLTEFVSLLDTDLIDSEEAQQWVKSYNHLEEGQDKEFGDANFSIYSDLFGVDTITLDIDALPYEY